MGKPLLIAVAGGSGSGKTTIVNLIKDHFPHLSVLVVQQDHYYRDWSHLPKEERDLVNFDHPDSLDLDLIYTHLLDLSRGKSVARPSYDFKTHCRDPISTELEPGPIVLFDGILALHEERTRDLFDLKVYVDVSDDLRFIRRMGRDMRERGRTTESVVSQYLATVKPMHDKYVAPTRAFADAIIPWNQWSEDNVMQVREFIKARFNNQISTV